MLNMNAGLTTRTIFLRVACLVLWAAVTAAAVTDRALAQAEPPAVEQATPPARMTPELLWKLGRLGDAALSADGAQVAYTVRRYDLAANTGSTSLFLVGRANGEARTVVEGWQSISNVQFAPSPLGERLYFVGTPAADAEDADGEETPQVWVVDLEQPQPRRVTSVDGGVANLKVAPTGRALAFTVDVKMDPTTLDLYPDLPHADGRIIDSLMYRHWDNWHDYKYSHLHVARLNDDLTVAATVDVMQGIRADCPVPPFGGAEQFAWSPDGAEIAYTAKLVANWAESTDSDIYLLGLDGDDSPKCITAGMDGYDNDPVYSPDGKYLAFHSMERPGFEADRNRIMLYERATGRIREATAGLDMTAHGALWRPDSATLVFYSEHRGTEQIFELDLATAATRPVTDGAFNWKSLAVTPDGQHVLASFENMIRPAELAVVSLSDGSSQPLSGINDEIYAHLELPIIEERWIRSTDGQNVHAWVVYPPDFDPHEKWPLVTFCQGGPQGQIGQWFSFRWNFHLMAAQGYVVLAPNRRGLPGFGQAWNDQISGDWGGQAMQDILATTDAMLAEPFIDPDRAAAVGASFGGYTVYWLMGHAEQRFCCMIAHAGVFNLESMYGSTEELFFVNWDLGGAYWKDSAVRQEYDLFTPHRYVGNWRTPLLVIHGERDFRVPVTQGMEAFTAAQVKGVPSRFLYFPSENHWVSSPQNSVLWQRVFFDWLDRYCK